MIKTLTKTIGGKEWKVTQFAGTRNLIVLHRLFSVICPTAAHGAGSGRSMSLSAELNFGAAVDALLERIGTSEEFTGLVKLILSCTFVDDEPLSEDRVFDRVFAGPAVMNLIPGIRFVMEANFGDFSGAAGGIMNLFAAATQDKGATPAPASKED